MRYKFTYEFNKAANDELIFNKDNDADVKDKVVELVFMCHGKMIDRGNNGSLRGGMSLRSETKSFELNCAEEFANEMMNYKAITSMKNISEPS